MSSRKLLKKFNDFLRRRSRASIIAMCLLMVAAILLGDFFTLKLVNSALFCLPPILIATWYVNEGFALALSITSTVGFFLTDEVWATNASHFAAVAVWNSLLPLIFFIFAVRMVSMLKSSYAREVALSRTDPLTGLFNRRYFNELCAAEADRCKRYGGPVTLAYLDMDNFKSVNDSPATAPVIGCSA